MSYDDPKERGYVSYGIDSESQWDDEGEETSFDYILIDLVYVRPEHRRQGVAREMMKAVVAELRKQELPVKLAALPKGDSIEMEDLVAFYASLGFSPTQEQGGDAVVMELR
jgi:GNAT superfamily N-acetyltransferase